jgi:hypothetical protein
MFGPTDWIELLFAAALVSLVLLRPWIEPAFRTLAPKTAWCMFLLAILPIALRLALLSHHPIPVPEIYDEFGHLLEADTLRRFRLANPPHPLPEFFETLFVLQEPTYSSIYPVGQGLSLAFGRMLFGLAWAGVLLSTAAFCSLCYWMLRGWVSPTLALLGGLLAVIEFGPLNQWMNSYWGGSLTAAAGCLVFGSLPRLRAGWRIRDALILGLGLSIHLLTRPYESAFLLLAGLLFFVRPAPTSVRGPLVASVTVAIPVLLAVAVILLQDQRVTGHWTTLPYQLSQYQYGVPAALTFQPNPTPHRDLTPQQQMDYKMQSSFRGVERETPAAFLRRLEYRVRFYRFYFLVPLYVALAAFLFGIRTYRFAWVVLTSLLFALGANFFPAFQFHYIAAIVCLFILMSVVGLQRLRAGPYLAGLCAIHFAFWYSVHLVDLPELRSFETWNAINHTGPVRRTFVRNELAQTPGRQLVFVRYWPGHIFQDEWVYNEADIDRAAIVWARDLGPENEKLLRYYRDRTTWLLEPDARPPRLSPYQPEAPTPAVPTATPEAPPEKPKPKPLQPKLRFEDVK